MSMEKNKKDNPIKTIYLFILDVFSHFAKDNGFILASSMVYSTLFSIVPFLTLITILFSKLNFIDNDAVKQLIHEKIISQIIPATQEQFIESLNSFIGNATTLGWIGFIVFLLTAMLLIKRIIDSFNLIYQAVPRQRIITRLASYVTGLIIGTLVIGMFLTFTQPLINILDQNRILSADHPISLLLTKTVPWVIIFVALLLLFKIIPSASVQWKSALLATTVATLLWQGSNLLFKWIINSLFSYKKIYGSLASAMFFFLWIYILWIVLFLSLEIAYVHQYKRVHGKKGMGDPNSPFNQLADGINILILIIQKYESTHKPISLAVISKGTFIPEKKLILQLNQFATEGLIIKPKRFRYNFFPAPDLEKLPLSQILKIEFGTPHFHEENKNIGKLLSSEILSCIENNTNEKTLFDLLHQNETEKTID